MRSAKRTILVCNCFINRLVNVKIKIRAIGGHHQSSHNRLINVNLIAGCSEMIEISLSLVDTTFVGSK